MNIIIKAEKCSNGNTDHEEEETKSRCWKFCFDCQGNEKYREYEMQPVAKLKI